MIGAELKAWRKAHKYSQATLGEELGVARQTVVAWEKTEVPLPRMIQLALKELERENFTAGQRYSAAEYRKQRTRPTEPGSKHARDS